ncbi:MAG: choice-of-anchor D domain-containing protein [Bacteroidetes bacterium]|nr:choice-of-anchor D domain-containing protein [Bacteroidota bacterium]
MIKLAIDKTGSIKLKKKPFQKYWLGVIINFIHIFLIINASAADIHVSTKDCTPAPCTTTGTGSFAIAYGQTVKWISQRSGSGGDDFYLSTVGPNHTDIPISTSLNTGDDSGEFFLNPGNYFIAINTGNMGDGTYSIKYNLVADCNVSPTSHNFGSHNAGSGGASRNFTISLAGDMLDVQIASINGTDNTHFVISGGTGTTLREGGPTSTNFTVDFVPGTTAGTFSSTITIVSTNPEVTVPPKTITVSGTTIALEPDIDCVSSSTYSLDYVTNPTGTFSKSFENDGNAALVINSISLGSNPSGVFSFNGAPSTANLSAGFSRSVSIRFTPPAFEQTYTGSIIISSNSPGETTKECSFTARAHHPEPNMAVSAVPDGGTTVNYNDVEIGFTFTKGIKVRNTGDASLTLTLDLDDPFDPDISQWSEINEPNSVTIPVGGEETYLQRFAPSVEGTYTFQIEALGTGGGGTYNSTQIITLTGNGISPVPMDNALVLDRSYSMSEAAGSRTKIDALQKAARLYYDLLRPDPGDGTGDKIGMVKYNHVSDFYFDPLQLKTATIEPTVLDLLSETAITDAARLKPSGSTCISCGMTDAASLLLASPDSRKQVMIVMTDGKETAGPGVSTVLGGIETDNPDLMIYSLGLGNDIDAPVLQDITNVVNGYHQVTENLLGTNHFALEEFYFKVYTNASGADLVVDPTHAIDFSSGIPVEVDRATIVSSDRYAVFMVLDDPALQGYYKLEFIDPHGNILDPTSSVGGIPIQVLQRNGHTIYKIIFPDISQAHTYTGDWVLRLSPTGEWEPDSTKRGQYYKLHYNYDVPGEWIHPYEGIVPIGFGAAVKSDYKMDVTATANKYQPGAQVLLTAKLTDRGWPSVGGHIDLTTTRPDDSHTTFQLYDDGTHGDIQINDGTYSNYYNYTNLEGSYRFFFNGQGVNERGELVPRQATRYISLSAPPEDDGSNIPTPCIPCWVEWLMLLVLLLMLIILIRCCYKVAKNRRE